MYVWPETGVRLIELERLGDLAVQRLDLGVIPLEQREKARLGAGRPLDAQEFQLPQPVLDFLEVKDQLMAPERRALAHRDQLRGLEVGVAEAGQVLPASGEVGQGVDRADDPVADQSERLSDQDQVGVVGDVATGRAQVEDRPGRRRGVAKSVDVGHHVMTQTPLVARGSLEVDRIDLGAQFADLGFGDVQAQVALGLGQRDPEPSPGRELAL